MTSENPDRSSVDNEDSQGSSKSSRSISSCGSVDVENHEAKGIRTSLPVVGSRTASPLLVVDVPEMTVADSLSPAKAPVAGTQDRLTAINHHPNVSHLYTIEAILGLNNQQHTKGKNFT